MQKPNNFILTTDYPTLKNDAGPTQLSAGINGLISIPAGATARGSVDLRIGSIGALARAKFASSKDGYTYYVGQNQIYNRTGTVTGSPAPYSIAAFVWRPSSGVLRFQVIIPNPYSGTLIGEAGDETILMQVNTFIAPYA